MRTSKTEAAPTKKALTHERIVRTAARAIRREGFAGVSVGDVMKEAGLTHGGFYAHFDSRDALLVEALDAAAGQALSSLQRSADQLTDRDPLAATIELYLSDRHLCAPEGGCTLAALGSDMPRQSPQVRSVATRRARDMAALVERQLAASAGRAKATKADRQRALGVMSALVGAMVIARAVDDAELSSEIRCATAQMVQS